MTREHSVQGQRLPWRSAERTYTIITPVGANAAVATHMKSAPTPPVDETRQLMVQGLRLLAGVWDDATPPQQALRSMDSLGLRATSLDWLADAALDDGEGRLNCDGSSAGHYDIALALRASATITAVRERVQCARQALRPGGALVLVTTVTMVTMVAAGAAGAAAGSDARETAVNGPTLVGDDVRVAINLPTVRGLLTAEGFIARVFAWQAAPTLAELAPTDRALPTPRRLLVIAALGDDAAARRLRLRSA